MPTHKRIRPYNTKNSYPDNPMDYDLCQAVKAAGTMVFLRGQVSQDLDTAEPLHIDNPAKQTAKTIANIKLLLNEAGASLEHICRTVVYITDIKYRQEIYQELGRQLKGVYPCSTGIVVSALARPEWVVEIEVTAMIPDDINNPTPS